MQQNKTFVKLIKEHEGIIFKVANLYTSNKEDQQDLYQEIVYQLWKSFESFKGKSKISTWMYRVALNTAIRQLNKEKRRPKNDDLTEVLNLKMEQVDALLEEQTKQLYEAIKTLNSIEKGIVLLYLEGKQYDEIAKITGFSSSNVGTRLSRIKVKLKKQVNQ